MALKKSQKSLKKWTKQKWRTPSGKKSSETGEVYAPAATIKKLKSTAKGKKKQAAANKKINEGVKKVLKKTKGGPKLGGKFTGPRKNVLKRMNMGGAIMKNRGGMFKGTY